MSSHNEKSPLTQNASGQERGPAIEARGLSEEDNGTARENCSAEKYPAPVQASEAVNQRPGMEEDQTEVVPTAEDILDASAVGGNGTSSKVSRVDVLTIVETERDGNWYEFAVNGHGGLIRVVARMEDDDHDYPLGKRVRDFLLAASHVEQHEAAPADSHYTHPGCEVCACPAGVRQAERASDVLLEPPVADERAALPRYTEWMHLRIHGVWSDGVPSWARDHAGHMNDLTAAIAVIEELAARTSSPNAAGAERIAHEVWAAAQLGPGEGIEDGTRRIAAILASAAAQVPEVIRAWETDDGRVLSDEQKQQALRDGGASASSVRPFSIALGRITPERAAQPAAEIVRERFAGRDRWDVKIIDRTLQYGAKLYAAPQHSAKADAQEGLTTEHAFALYMLARTSDSERWINELRKSIDAHSGQPEPLASAGVIAAARAVIEADRAQTLTTEHVNALDNAIKIQRGELTLLELRAEVTDDGKYCAGESHE